MKRLIISCAFALVTMGINAQNTLNLGGDISMLPQYEQAGIPYYRSNGAKIDDVLAYMKSTCKMNSMRVRLFVNPDNSKDVSLVQNLEYVKKLGKRIKDEGMDFLLDIHYSDSWADPSHQAIPAAWTNTTNTALVEQMYTYTKEVLNGLKEYGATPDFVQLGNEISYGMLWRNESDRCYANASATVWKRLANLLISAGKAVREVTPDAKIVLHIERSGDVDGATRFFNYMNTYKVDYDIIGLSYYPFWHKDLATLGNTLQTLQANYPDKPVQIVETAYYYQWFPTGSDIINTTDTWPATATGQKAFIEDLCKELAKHSNVTGLYYWFPEANGGGGSVIPAGDSSNNRGLWNDSSHRTNNGITSLKKFLTEKEAVGVSRVSTGMETDNASIYTLGGTRINTISNPGIYIKGKKKYFNIAGH